jgi:hypothetical protein
MWRVPQQRGTKGSLRRIQEFVNDRATELDSTLAVASGGRVAGPVNWRSPLKDDEYAEYCDGGWLERLGLELPQRSLDSFSPRRGPQWDALGMTAANEPMLVEANPLSRRSSPWNGGDGSLTRQNQGVFREVADFLGVKSSCDWTGTFYQYANRLAHLYLLN